MKTLYIIICFFLTNYLVAQKSIEGFVYEINKDDKKSKKEPISMANIYWQGTTTGVVTDVNGKFQINEPQSYPASLIVSFVGYQSDTIVFNDYQKNIETNNVICNADPPAVYEKMLNGNQNNSIMFKWKKNRMEYSMGLFVYYFGTLKW